MNLIPLLIEPIPIAIPVSSRGFPMPSPAETKTIIQREPYQETEPDRSQRQHTNQCNLHRGIYIPHYPLYLVHLLSTWCLLRVISLRPPLNASPLNSLFRHIPHNLPSTCLLVAFQGRHAFETLPFHLQLDVGVVVEYPRRDNCNDRPICFGKRPTCVDEFLFGIGEVHGCTGFVLTVAA